MSFRSWSRRCRFFNPRFGACAVVQLNKQKRHESRLKREQAKGAMLGHDVVCFYSQYSLKKSMSWIFYCRKCKANFTLLKQFSQPWKRSCPGKTRYSLWWERICVANGVDVVANGIAATQKEQKEIQSTIQYVQDHAVKRQKNKMDMRRRRAAQARA